MTRQLDPVAVAAIIDRHPTPEDAINWALDRAAKYEAETSIGHLAARIEAAHFAADYLRLAEAIEATTKENT